MLRFVVTTALRLLLVLFAADALAQGYPTKPIRLIVTTAPGGLMDVPARLAADYLDRALGQRFLVENRGGAGGNLGTEAVAKAPSDGYTLGVIQLGNVAVNPFLYKDLPYHPLNDLVPIAPLTSSPIVVTTSAKLPVHTLAEFIDYARREPGKVNHGSAGQGTVPHLAGELFAQLAGIKLTHVHYRGAGPAVTDLVSGQVHVVFVGYGVVRGHVASGAVKSLAVSQRVRLKMAPEVPTSEEAGLPGYEFITWFGLAAPKGTPDAIVQVINRHVQAMLDDPTIQKRLADGGLEPLKESSEQFRARIRRDYEKFRKVVADAGLKPE